MIRLRLIFIGLVAVALILIIRLYFIQVVHSQEYIDRADRQYVSPSTKIFDRGAILFQNKDNSLLSAASLSTGYVVSLNPQKIIDPEAVLAGLRQYILIEPETFYAKISRKNSQYEKVADKLNEETIKKIQALKLPGVEITKMRWRYYPGDDLSSRVIGFVGYDKDSNLVGRYGLEKYYEDTLSRKDSKLYVNFFAEIFSDINQVIENDTHRQGDIILSIEPTVQNFLEDELAKIEADYHSKLTGGIIVDPMTGEIYAMGINPTFDLNNFNLVTDISVFNNPLVEGVYELGSIIKPLTVAAGLDAGVITANTTYEDKGSLTLDGYTIYNHDKKAHGVVDMQQVLNRSLNLGVSFVVNRLGNDRFADYFRKFGLDEETGIDLPGENHGRLDNFNNPRDIEYATASFGQGISLTPIGTVRALSALANGGKLITPHIVKRINYTNGLFNNVSYAGQARQVLKKTTSEEISRMLVGVVDKALANGTMMLPRYSVAAKTGTAQMAKPGGGYYEDKFLHSFFGYFPAYNPRFLVFLYTIEPQGVSFASQTLTNPFMNIVKFLINYYNIAPDR